MRYAVFCIRTDIIRKRSIIMALFHLEIESEYLGANTDVHVIKAGNYQRGRLL